MSLRDRRLYATDLGKVVTDKLVEAFPKLMDVGYTREMEAELDKIEEEHLDWVRMLHQFYGPFKESLDRAHEDMGHAGAPEPAPFPCPKCGAPTVYRFSKTGRFLTCSKDREACDYRASIDREGNPQTPELSDIVCPACNAARMIRRKGRFGAFLSCENYPACKGILKLDPKKGTVVLPKTPPLLTDLACATCGKPLNLRRSARGPWLSCSGFPKCRGRMAWSGVDDAKKAALEADLAAHERAHPLPTVKNTAGRVLGEDYVPQVAEEGGGGESPSGGDANPPTLDSDAA